MSTSPGFTIKDRDEAFASNPQSIWMQTDIDAILRGIYDTSVKTGCAVTAQGSPDMTVAVASGTVVSGGVERTVSSGNVTIGAADASDPRVDCVVATSAGAKAVRAGAAASNPKMPELTAGDVLLGAVLVPAAATTIISSYITDKRVFNLWSVNSDGDHEAGDNVHSLYWHTLESAPATSGDTLKATGRIQMRAHYWSAADLYLDGRLYNQVLSDGSGGFGTRLVWESLTAATTARSIFHVVAFARSGGAHGGVEFDSMRTVHDSGGGIAVRGGLEFYNYNESVAALAGSPSLVGDGATIGLKNDARIRWRNQAGNGDIDGIYVDSSNRVHFGATAYVQGDDLIVANAGARLTIGSVAATTGAIRLENATYIYARNAANGANIQALGVNGSNQVAIGGSGGGALVSENLLTTGYMRVGSSSAPGNTTAGDFYAERLSFGDATVTFASMENSLIGVKKNVGVPSTSGPTSQGYVEVVFTPAGGTAQVRQALHLTSTVQPSAADGGFYRGLTITAQHDSGAFNITGRLLGAQIDVLNSAAGTLGRMLGIDMTLTTSAGTTTNGHGIRMQLTGSGGGGMTAMNYIDILAPASLPTGITTHRGVNIGNLGGSGVTTAVGVDVAAQSGAGTNYGIRNAGSLKQSGDVGFYGTEPVAKQTGVAVTAAGVHAALVNLGLIAA